jgi:hypothetical protein
MIVSIYCIIYIYIYTFILDRSLTRTLKS